MVRNSSPLQRFESLILGKRMNKRCINSKPYERLTTSYPNLYGDNFIFSIPNSWHPLLESLSKKISSVMSEAQDFSINVYDVKQLHNQLKFYYGLSGPEDGYDELTTQIDELITLTNTQIQTND